MTRRLFSAVAFAFIIGLIADDANAQSESSSSVDDSSPPNVLMICVDDLNDWVEPLGGHPQVRTPAMRSLAERGMNFTNAHCQAPLCNASRTSLMISKRPSSTGIYGLAPWFRELEEFRDIQSLPQTFAKAGYRTYTAGKVYHGGRFHSPPPGVAPEFQFIGPGGGPGKTPPKKLIPSTPAGNNPWMDWGVFDHDISEKGDYKVASWITDQLHTMEGDQPFFMSCGFFLPHVPCHVTPKFWDMYPEESLVMPPIDRTERSDCSPFAWYLHWNLPEPRLSWLEHYDEHKNLVRAYLGCITFMDTQLQRVLDALEASPYADNTIVCLWSDHGWHLGEKNISGKNSLWEPSTHVPLIFAGPGIEPGTSDQPVELLDVFPTLTDLVGLEAPATVEGLSLLPQLRDPNTPRRPAITEANPGNQGIRDERYRLIRYADGSEELYDLAADPNEIRNVIDDPQHAAAATRLRDFVIDDPRPLAENSRARVLEQREDGWYWEGKRINPDQPPMNIEPHQPADLPRVVTSP